jgi:IclR family mhp operon transcriptional activator
MRALRDASPATLRSVAARTAISRGAVHRILHTLVQDGYLRNAEGAYVLRSRTLALSAAAAEANWIEAAQRGVKELCVQTKWPILVSRQNGMAMQICAEAEDLSPMRLRRLKIGQKLPLLVSASGRAVLAQYSEAVRELLLREVAANPEFALDEAIMRTPEEIRDRLKRVEDRGYSLGVANRTSLLSVPIATASGRILGALSLRYFTSAASSQDIVARHLKAMRQTAAEIASAA